MPSKALENYLDNIIGSDHKIKPMTRRDANRHLFNYYTDKAQEDAEKGIYPDQYVLTEEDKKILKELAERFRRE